MASKLDKALGTHINIDSSNIPDDVILETDVGPGAITVTELASDAVTNVKVDAAADIVVTKLKEGTADQVVKTNAGATALEHGKLQGANVDFFQSAEIAGTGSEANTAHGLGRTPTVVIVYITQKDTTTAFDLVEGVHDGTNIKVNLETTCKYKIVAF